MQKLIHLKNSPRQLIMGALKKVVLNICDLLFLIILHKKWTLSLVSLEDLVTFSRAFLFDFYSAVCIY